MVYASFFGFYSLILSSAAGRRLTISRSATLVPSITGGRKLFVDINTLLSVGGLSRVSKAVFQPEPRFNLKRQVFQTGRFRGLQAPGSSNGRGAPGAC
jgi:hypothetical protein